MCKRVISMGIGAPLLLALETAVIKKIEEEGVAPESAPFQVMQDIEYYNRRDEETIVRYYIAGRHSERNFGAPK